MGVILKPLFEVLTGDVAVMDNVVYNYICMGLIGLFAYGASYRLVGNAYEVGAINGRAAGSALHWALRVVLFFATAYIVRGGIWLYNFLIAVPHWVWWLIAGVAAAAVLLGVVLHYAKERRLAKNDGAYQKEN